MRFFIASSATFFLIEYHLRKLVLESIEAKHVISELACICASQRRRFLFTPMAADPTLGVTVRLPLRMTIAFKSHRSAKTSRFHPHTAPFNSVSGLCGRLHTWYLPRRFHRKSLDFSLPTLTAHLAVDGHPNRIIQQLLNNHLSSPLHFPIVRQIASSQPFSLPSYHHSHCHWPSYQPAVCIIREPAIQFLRVMKANTLSFLYKATSTTSYPQKRENFLLTSGSTPPSIICSSHDLLHRSSSNMYNIIPSPYIFRCRAVLHLWLLSTPVLYLSPAYALRIRCIRISNWAGFVLMLDLFLCCL